MRVVNYFESDRKDHWLAAIARSDWRAGAFLCRLITEGTLGETLGESTRVLLLTDGDELVSYCTYAEKDDIQPTEFTPWIGFVYTFPKYRARRCAGRLFDEAERIAAAEGVSRIYLSTNHVGLYEKYGFTFWQMMDDVDGEPSRVYIKTIKQRI
ncbi:MAG: GNAT family N-acetyltransferase [Oscillospiraceae bacterium]|nr:GNAT family N-acetyltransferase [Oscillospiraceae bacterium]